MIKNLFPIIKPGRTHWIKKASHQKTPLFRAFSQTSTKPKMIANKFRDLLFVNSAFKELRIEQNKRNHVHQVGNYHYSKAVTEKLANPTIIGISEDAAKLLDLTPSSFENQEHYLIGNKIPGTSKPISHCYVGYQFGHLAGQLGDGRAISLGDVRNQKGELWELQYKGAGKTPYSRMADGRAVLRSSIREYLASEYMFHLGVRTTRALSLVVSTDTVPRDPKYNGNVIQENCAVVIRMAHCLIRFGSFQINLKKRKEDRNFDVNLLHEISQFVIKNHYSHLVKTPEGEEPTSDYLKTLYVDWFKEIVERVAETTADWQCYGFCHGVLNTDNISILGDTIDYGPYGFLEHYDNFHICNSSDEWGRYAYCEQPAILKWNLIKLLDSLKLILSEDEASELYTFIEEQYDVLFDRYYYQKMANKLGLKNVDEDVKTLVKNFLDVMDFVRADFTNTFLQLEKFGKDSDVGCFSVNLLNNSPEYPVWRKTFSSKFDATQLKSIFEDPKKRMSVMFQLGTFPEKFFMDQIAKDAIYEHWNQTKQNEIPGEISRRWSKWLELYKAQLQKEALPEEERLQLMAKTNPAFCLRNYLLQEAIVDAEKGDFKKFAVIEELINNPYDRSLMAKYPGHFKSPPEWARNLTVSCSS